MDRRGVRRNRAGLAIVGAILVLAGLAALARSLGLFPGVLGPADTAVTDSRVRELTSDNTWFWVALAIVSIVVALLALWWLISQLRSSATRTLRLEPDPRHGTTTVPARVAGGALEADLVDSPHFRQAQATLLGNPARPRLYLTATLLASADFGAAKQRLHEALSRYRRAMDAQETPTTVLLRSSR